MSKFKIQNQEDFNECLMWVSDLYKDVYGFRPRGYNWDAFSFQELTDFVNDLSKQAEEEAAYERECEEKSIKGVMSLGVNRKTALRWLDQADAYFMYGDDPFYEDSVEKYGWVAKHYDNLICK
jgi:hypothetical protein